MLWNVLITPETGNRVKRASFDLFTEAENYCVTEQEKFRINWKIYKILQSLSLVDCQNFIYVVFFHVNLRENKDRTQ